MWWDEFEVQLNFAFTAYARSEGRDIHSENMKLRILTKKINADLLSHTKASILTHMTSVPKTMAYLQALPTFRQAVNQKHPPGTNKSVCRINETSRGRGGQGYYRGGRYGGRNGRGGRGGNNNQKNIKHLQSYPVTLNNGKIVDIHSSYFLGPKIWSQTNLANRFYLTQDRSQYKMQQAQSTIATLNSQSTIATLNTQMHPANS